MSPTGKRILYHLFGYHHDCLRGESPIAMVEQVFQTGPKQVDDEDVVEAFLPEIVHIWNASWERLVTNFGLRS